jgi:hypothetical protein
MKKILALVAGAVVSFNASAGYIQYDFQPGGNLSGYFVQNDTYNEIVFYDIRVKDQYVDTWFTPAGVNGNIYDAWRTPTQTGPTNFSVVDALTYHYVSNLVLKFGGTGGDLAYKAWYTQVVDPTFGFPDDENHEVSVRYAGLVARSTISPDLAAELDAHGGYAENIRRWGTDIRADVPEPATLGLFAIGALGVAGAARRRRAAR